MWHQRVTGKSEDKYEDNTQKDLEQIRCKIYILWICLKIIPTCPVPTGRFPTGPYPTDPFATNPFSTGPFPTDPFSTDPFPPG